MTIRKNLSDKKKWFLWAKSAGRCQYSDCNKPLWKNSSAKEECNSAYIAHIVATSPNGPRGDVDLSEKLADDISNLILLCDTHHRLIDKEDVEGHSVERLTEMKNEHEEQIEYLTSLIGNNKTKIIIYGSNIGQHNSAIDVRESRSAVIPKRTPALDVVKISLQNSSMEDDQKNYWPNEVEHLESSYNKRVKPYLESDDFSHLTFFGLAPIPLLIKVGVLLSDISDVEVRQLTKEPRTWKWDEVDNALDFAIHKPDEANQENNIALIVSTSAKISHERIQTLLPNVDIWEVSASDINNDNIRVRSSLKKFRKIFRRVLAEIKESYQDKKSISVFPSVSISIATEMGRVWNGKSDLPMHIYDNQNKNCGFFYTLTIE